jgi:hypothetical protein
MPMHDWTRVDDGIYHDFHTGWIGELRKVLNGGTLPKGYYALAEQQTEDYRPDVPTLHRPRPDDESTEPGGIAVAAAPPKVEFTATADRKAYTAKRRTLVIHHRSNDRVVAMIELVSQGNKRTRRELDGFVRKACGLIEAGVHLLVVDPFPPGKRDPEGLHGAIWSELQDESYRRPEGRPLTLASYSAGPVTTARVQPYAVGDALPDMPLFLTADHYVPVALERAYLGAWEGTPEEVREVVAGPSA